MAYEVTLIAINFVPRIALRKLELHLSRTLVA